MRNEVYRWRQCKKLLITAALENPDSYTLLVVGKFLVLRGSYYGNGL